MHCHRFNICLALPLPWCENTITDYSYGVFTPEQDNDKTNVEPVHSYHAVHTRSDKPGVKGIIGMHRFDICLVVVLLWCENTIN